MRGSPTHGVGGTSCLVSDWHSKVTAPQLLFTLPEMSYHTLRLVSVLSLPNTTEATTPRCQLLLTHINIHMPFYAIP